MFSNNVSQAKGRVKVAYMSLCTVRLSVNAVLFVICAGPTSTVPFVESERHQASDVEPRQPRDDVRRQTSVETDSASSLEQQMKTRQSKITDVILSSFYRAACMRSFL